MMTDQHLATVRKWYANATTTSYAVDQLLSVVEKELHLKAHQLMHADSICCDDVNAIQYPARAHDMLGPFNMGGLNGFPFAGLTGMNAFAHHVPEDGAVFIFYAPHIGITKEGSLGEIHRIGQNTASACCGAAKAALANLLKDEIKEDNITELDYQFNTIEQIFLKQSGRIKSAQHKIFEATEVMYEAIDNRMQELVSKTDYPCKYVLMIGAILINGDSDMGSYCSFKRFEYIELETGERHSLLDACYEE
ncbi:MAG TPA: hypothetical protein VM871_11295 [Flavisolibacter sp.]|nr:hypothetical protein [Flavisolibacter sp.]